jgi:RNA polymerase sigma-70 factor (ECF subfamily)
MQTAEELTDLPGLAAGAPARQRLDETLMKSIAAGSRDAVQVLFQRHSVRVYRFVLRLTGNACLAEDITSEVFLDVWRQAGAFQARSQVTTWLLAIAHHKAVSAMRCPVQLQLEKLAAEAIPDPGDDAETAMDKEDRGRIVRKCLTQLSPAHRAVIELAYYHGKSVEEVAQIVGAPEGTVKTRMFHARNQMAKMLAAEGIKTAQPC